jgi:hypothetical protein
MMAVYDLDGNNELDPHELVALVNDELLNTIVRLVATVPRPTTFTFARAEASDTTDIASGEMVHSILDPSEIREVEVEEEDAEDVTIEININDAVAGAAATPLGDSLGAIGEEGEEEDSGDVIGPPPVAHPPPPPMPPSQPKAHRKQSVLGAATSSFDSSNAVVASAATAPAASTETLAAGVLLEPSSFRSMLETEMGPPSSAPATTAAVDAFDAFAPPSDESVPLLEAPSAPAPAVPPFSPQLILPPPPPPPTSVIAAVSASEASKIELKREQEVMEARNELILLKQSDLQERKVLDEFLVHEAAAKKAEDAAVAAAAAAAAAGPKDGNDHFMALLLRTALAYK